MTAAGGGHIYLHICRETRLTALGCTVVTSSTEAPSPSCSGQEALFGLIRAHVWRRPDDYPSSCSSPAVSAEASPVLLGRLRLSGLNGRTGGPPTLRRRSETDVRRRVGRAQAVTASLSRLRRRWPRRHRRRRKRRRSCPGTSTSKAGAETAAPGGPSRELPCPSARPFQRRLWHPQVLLWIS